MSYINEEELQRRLNDVRMEKFEQSVNRKKLAEYFRRYVDPFRCKACTFDIVKSTSATLKDWTPQRVITAQKIIQAVTMVTGVTVEQMEAKSRKRPLAEARQIAMYLMRKETTMTQKEIGNTFGNRDHTTAIHSQQTVQALIESNPKFATLVNQITRIL